jgi:ligand-binding sensor domain-containing protein
MLGPLLAFICLSLALSGCDGKKKPPADEGAKAISNADAPEPREAAPPEPEHEFSDEEQLSPFVRRIFQDRSGSLWFGTNGDGVIRYDGKAVEYFSTGEGFGGTVVRGIVQDEKGDLWFGTENGLTRYNGASFTNLSEEDGLIGRSVWGFALDSTGTIWIGTLKGVSRYYRGEFTPFALPESEPDPARGVTSARLVRAIMEDSKGRMWFGSNGGAHIYDGDSLTNISEKDGLCHDSVNAILEDKGGNIWFATHDNGVCRFDGTSFTHFTGEHGVVGTEVWSLYEDRSGDIWFPVENSGVYRFDGESFANFQEQQGLTTNAIQSIYEDREGRIWLGGWKGLFRYDGSSMVRVGTKGPWR